MNGSHDSLNSIGQNNKNRDHFDFDSLNDPTGEER